jgi:hypothetical protein
MRPVQPRVHFSRLSSGVIATVSSRDYAAGGQIDKWSLYDRGGVPHRWSARSELSEVQGVYPHITFGVTMRIPLILATILIGGYCVATAQPARPATASQPAALRCTIAVPERGVIVTGPGHPPLHVVLENVSDHPLRLIDEWNSWGFFNLTLNFTTPDGAKHKIEKVGRDWDKNFLTSTILQPGQMLVRDVAFDPAVWTGLPEAGIVTLTATFKQDEPGKLDDKGPAYWSGTAESPEVKIELRKGQ